MYMLVNIPHTYHGVLITEKGDPFDYLKKGLKIKGEKKTAR